MAYTITRKRMYIKFPFHLRFPGGGRGDKNYRRIFSKRSVNRQKPILLNLVNFVIYHMSFKTALLKCRRTIHLIDSGNWPKIGLWRSVGSCDTFSKIFLSIIFVPSPIYRMRIRIGIFSTFFFREMVSCGCIWICLVQMLISFRFRT